MNAPSPARHYTVLAMKWGPKYGPEYVNMLYGMVARNLTLPFQFVCFTDDATDIRDEVICRPLPEIEVPDAHSHVPWRKVSLYRPDLLEWSGKALFIDLDVVITGSLNDLFTYTDKLGIAENWTQPGKNIGNTSVFTFNLGSMGYIYERYCKTSSTLFDRFNNSQKFVSETAHARGDLHYFPKTWVRSFKVDCMPGGIMNWFATPRLPADARIVAFHGDPKPPDAARGHYPGKWYKHVRPTPWITDHWR